MTGTTTTTIGHLRARGSGITQPTTTVELFFDPSVCAVTQPSHQMLDDLEGTHFAERCQVFIIIAVGGSIVVTGATA